MGSCEIILLVKVGLHYSPHTVGAAVFLLHPFLIFYISSRKSLWWDYTEEKKKKTLDICCRLSAILSISLLNSILPNAHHLPTLCNQTGQTTLRSSGSPLWENGSCTGFLSITLSLLHQHQIGLQPAWHCADSRGNWTRNRLLMTNLPPTHSSAICGWLIFIKGLEWNQNEARVDDTSLQS